MNIARSSNPHEALAKYLTNIIYRDNDIQGLSHIAYILQTLKQGGYHKYISLSRNPKKDMMNDLLAVGLTEIARLVDDGVFDEKPDTAWNNR